LLSYVIKRFSKILNLERKEVKIMKIKKFGFLLLVSFFMVGIWSANVMALPIDHGVPIIAIDGDSDANVTVSILSAGGSETFLYGYFLNGGTFTELSGGYSVIEFNGGDVIDFALMDTTNGLFYRLSGDLSDSSYSVAMTFANEVTYGDPQQPSGWTDPYYYNANITWTLPSIINTNELALNFINNGNDGIAPASVPEPSTLMLLGSGLVGIGLYRRRRTKR
jgi:hypothetical protein